MERDLILDCIDIAQQAPSGSNRQTWQWMVIGDPAKKKAVAEMYATHFYAYAEQPGATYDPADTRAERQGAVRSSAYYLADNFHLAPYLVIPMIEGRLDEGLPTFAQASQWGSILPAVWSFMLALRARGLGSAWTTLHLPDEKRTAELLGIPYDEYTQVGLFPVAYTKGTDFKLAARLPASETTHWDSFVQR